MSSEVVSRQSWGQAFSAHQTPLTTEDRLLSSPVRPHEHTDDNKVNDTPTFLDPFNGSKTVSTPSLSASTMMPPSPLQAACAYRTSSCTQPHSPLPPLPVDDVEDAVILEAKEVLVQQYPSKPRLISIEQDPEKPTTASASSSSSSTPTATTCHSFRHGSQETLNDIQSRRPKRSITENETPSAPSSNKASRAKPRKMSNDDENYLTCQSALLQIPGPGLPSRPATAVVEKHDDKDEFSLEEMKSSATSISVHTCHRQPSPLSYQWSPSSPELNVKEQPEPKPGQSRNVSAPREDTRSKPPARRPKPPKPPRLQISTDFDTKATTPQKTPAEKFYKHHIMSASRALFSTHKSEDSMSTPPPTSTPSNPMAPLSPRNIKSLFGLTRKKSYSMRNDYPSPVDSPMRGDSPNVFLETPTTPVNGIPSPPLSAELARKHSIATSISSKKSSSRLSSAFFSRNKSSPR